MKDYSFFAYDQSEALHLSHREKQTIVRCMDDLGEEACHIADTHSDSLLSGLLECLLDYCTRYYERQFITRGPANEQLMRRYESVLNDYIRGGKLRTHGLPPTEYCSQRLGLSSAYFSDMVEHETGKRPDTYVELKRMQIARQRLLTTKAPVRAIAEELGFPSSQFFCSLFKKITGLTPDRYRTLC
ncbi:MAG: helix-turn-helix transcriptional regulator [Alistipes sp.]